MENTNVVQFDPQVMQWYNNLKTVAKKHLNMEVSDGDTPEGKPIVAHQNFQRLINNITIDKTMNIYERTHLLIGLMINTYCHQRKLKPKLNNKDLNFIGDQLWHKYANDELRGDKPKNTYLANNVLNKFIEMLTEEEG